MLVQKMHVVVLERTARNRPKERAACFLFFIRPIKFLICHVAVFFDASICKSGKGKLTKIHHIMQTL